MNKDPFLDKVQKDLHELSLQPSPPIPIISLDPGMDNVGFIRGFFVIDPREKKTFLYLDPAGFHCDAVVSSKWQKTEDYCRAFKHWILSLICKEDLSPLKMPVALIERQYIVPPAATKETIPVGKWWTSMKLHTIQTILYTLLDSFGFNVQFINSFSYKKQLGISTGNHYQNKKTAMEFAKSVLPLELYQRVAENHHICDCINQMYWWLRSIYHYPVIIKSSRC